MQNQIIGAIKIKDGLFIGDEYAAQDTEFVTSNKVTYIINCAGSQVPNHFEQQKVQYLTFQWMESDKQVVFDENDENLNLIYNFMEQCFSQGESCLVHSVRGQSRACCVLAAYFMKKFAWTLYKALEFLNSRRPDLEIRASFFYQLTSLEARISATNSKRTGSWNEVSDDDTVKKEEMIIRNTFLNSQIGPIDDVFVTRPLKEKLLEQPFHKFKLRWRDQATQQGIQTIIFNGSPDFIPLTDKHIPKLKYVKSALKGSENKSQEIKRPTTQTQVNTSTQQTAQLRSHSNKSIGDPEKNSHNETKTEPSQHQQQIQTSHQNTNPSIISSFQQLSNNPSFNNLLASCSIKLQQQQQQIREGRKEPKPIQPQLNHINPVQPTQQKTPTQNTQSQIQQNPSKPPLQQNQGHKKQLQSFGEIKQEQPETTMPRSSSLQQFDDRKINPPERTNSVKDKLDIKLQPEPTQKTIMSTFQDFKQQVQLSLSYFNQNQYDQKKQESQQAVRMSLPEEKQKASFKQLDQLISPTQQQKSNSLNPPSFSNLSKIQNSSFLQEPIYGANVQSNFQKFQQLQNYQEQDKSTCDKSIRNSSIQRNDHNKRPSSNESQKLQEYTKQVPKKPLDPRTLEKKPSPSNLKQRKTPNQNPFGPPPPPQSSSQLYLRNVQQRRQASSTMRNQRGINSTFTNNSNFSINSQTNLQNNSYTYTQGNDNSRLLEKQVEILNQNRSTLIKNMNDSKADFAQLKKTISPTQQFANSKSQTVFSKNQPVKITQDISDKLNIQIQAPQSSNIMKEKDSNVSTSLINMNVHFKQPRQFSPGLKSENHLKTVNSQKLSVSQNIKSKFRSNSPGVTQKENDVSVGFQSNSFLGKHQSKNSWKML